jgi:hypothetical protein
MPGLNFLPARSAIDATFDSWLTATLSTDTSYAYSATRSSTALPPANGPVPVIAWMPVSVAIRPRSISFLVSRRTLSTLAPVSICDTLAAGMPALIAFTIAADTV